VPSRCLSKVHPFIDTDRHCLRARLFRSGTSDQFAEALHRENARANRSEKHGRIVCVFFQDSVLLLPYDCGIDGERQKENIMRKVVVTEFMSLDGVMEEPGWTFKYWNDEIAKFKGEESSASDALHLGRVTYQRFAAA
jgi:hypothetical protein